MRLSKNNLLKRESCSQNWNFEALKEVKLKSKWIWRKSCKEKVLTWGTEGRPQLREWIGSHCGTGWASPEQKIQSLPMAVLKVCSLTSLQKGKVSYLPFQNGRKLNIYLHKQCHSSCIWVPLWETPLTAGCLCVILPKVGHLLSASLNFDWVDCPYSSPSRPWRCFNCHEQNHWENFVSNSESELCVTVADVEDTMDAKQKAP